MSDPSEDGSSSSSESDASTLTIPVRQPNHDESQDDPDTDEEDIDRPPLQRDSPSPQPSVDNPPFILLNGPEGERALNEKFREFWMASIAEGFRDDLEEIRKEPNLGPSRLALLIQSLASGADVFSSSSAGGRVNEVEVVSDQLP
ncbi:hypothetical protein HD554DRAFT_2168604 [Boletus coccyginus]|nr:hypothetical protein HD554DRAFT_2168604 [Boletus coccyginus]